MNHFTFDTIEIGQKAEFQYDLDENKMAMFLHITGDENPLHNDLSFAKKVGYDEKVVYGMLSASVLSTLAGMYIPGERSLIHCVEINFVRPVFLSQCPLTVEAEVVAKDERFSQISLKYNIYNSLKEKVCRGTMKIGFINLEGD